MPADLHVPAERRAGRPGGRGARLLAAMADVDLDEPHRLLLEEAARVADRLEVLDAMLDGRHGEWLRLRDDVSGVEVRVVVDSVLGEARQQGALLRGLVAELRQASGAGGKGSKGSKGSGTVPKGPVTSSKGGIGDLTARIAARGGSAAG